MNRIWFRHGFLNLVEHGLTRFADAGLSFFLIWLLPTEVFSKLALSQAAVAPVLVLFLSPELVLYRDYGRWKSLGEDALASRVRGLRNLAMWKVPVAWALAWGLATLKGDSGQSTRFWAALWALALALTPQICGPDREFLRLSLRLKSLNALSLIQKAMLVAFTVGAVVLFPARIEGVALAAWLALVGSAVLSRWTAERGLCRDGATARGLRGEAGPSAWMLLREGVGSFSIWSHLVGVIQNTVQTLDLLVLGFLGTPAFEAGLYGAGLKVANLSQAVPLAISNLFGVWMGRRSGSGDGSDTQDQLDRKRIFQTTGVLILSSALTAALLWCAGPWLLAVLSRGRWDLAAQSRMTGWLGWILIGNIGICASMAAGSWLMLRRSPQTVLLAVSLPWGALSIVAYAWSARSGGIDAVARANVMVGLASVILVGCALWNSSRPKSLANPQSAKAADFSGPAG